MALEIRADNTKEFLELMQQATEKALEEIGLTAETYAKMACPVGTPESTGKPGYVGGTLRGSITHQTDADAKEVMIGTNVEYGKYVELGTIHMRERPFLRPAATDHEDEYTRIVKSSLQNA